MTEPVPENVRLILEQKLAYLNTVANVCMLWWVSSVVFSTTVLAGLWNQRGKLDMSFLFKFGLGSLVTIFFCTIVGFGIAVILYIRSLRSDLSNNLRSLGCPESHFDSELTAFRRAMLLGTSSFVLVLFSWLFLMPHVLASTTQR